MMAMNNKSPELRRILIKKLLDLSNLDFISRIRWGGVKSRETGRVYVYRARDLRETQDTEESSEYRQKAV